MKAQLALTFFFSLAWGTRLNQWWDPSMTKQGKAWEELTIHKIIAMTAFPFHWDPSMHTHTQEDPLLYVRQGRPSPPWLWSLGLTRLMSTNLVPLFHGKTAATHPPICLKKTHTLLKSSPAVSQHTHNSYLTLFPLSCLSPLRHTNGQSSVPPFHTVLCSKGSWQGM